MSSVAARSFGISASVMRPTSPYLNAPPLAHSTTSPIAWFLVVATRRATVRNSLRSWLNPELAADPLPLLGAGVEGVPQALGLATAFPPFGTELLSGSEGFVTGWGAVAAGSVSEGEPGMTPSVAEEPFTIGG